MKKRIVIALGGNALGKTLEEQNEKIKNTAKNIVDLINYGLEVIITHGNGPQVGMINDAMELSHEKIGTIEMPFAECTAMSQGYLGYFLQRAINTELEKRNILKKCITIVSEVLVDKNDEAFNNPTKPIGVFYTKEEAEKKEKEDGFIYKEDAGRGFRRVIASPKPLEIMQLKTIKDLLKRKHIVVACGGGGIPIIKNGTEYESVEAVIDKDKTSAKLAIDLKADMLLILTDVDKVCLNYKKENEIKLDKMTVTEAGKYINEKEFSEGSMLPKIEACIEFLNNNKKGEAIITSINKVSDALLKKDGTLIKRS